MHRNDLAEVSEALFARSGVRRGKRVPQPTAILLEPFRLQMDGRITCKRLMHCYLQTRTKEDPLAAPSRRHKDYGNILEDVSLIKGREIWIRVVPIARFDGHAAAQP